MDLTDKVIVIGLMAMGAGILRLWQLWLERRR